MAQSSSVDLTILLFGGTIAMLLLAGGIVTFIILYQRRILQKNLQLKEIETIHQKELFHGTLDAIETERQRLARDLHDEVGAALSTLRMSLSQIQHQLSKNQNVEVLAENSKMMIDSTIDSVRRISNDLLPNGLAELGLAYAVEALCNKIMKVSDVNIELDFEEINVPDTRLNLILYRIIQELLNNAIKYSQSTEIALSLRKSNSQLLLHYKDNGKGFDFEEAYRRGGLGLKNIETRTKMLNGEVSFATQPNQGLEVSTTIPIQNNLS